jgi:hypothetical protein
MTIRQAKRLNVGDSFRMPSTNSHDVDGFRVYSVISKTDEGIQVQDSFGYVSNLNWASKGLAIVLKAAVV